MAATGSDSQQQLAAARGEKKALSDRVACLFDEVAHLVLPWLPLDARARAACSREAWRAAAAAPALWGELSFEKCAARVTDATLAALCARAGPGLRSLRLHWRACRDVSGAGLVAALRDGGCAGVRRIHDDSALDLFGGGCSPALIQLATACPELEHTEFKVSRRSLAEAAQVAAALPGPLTMDHEAVCGERTCT